MEVVWRHLKGAEAPLEPDNTSGCWALKSKTLGDLTIWIHIVFFVFRLPGRRLVQRCPRLGPNSVWDVALVTPLTTLNSSGGRGQSPPPWPRCLWSDGMWTPGWEKRGQVIMRLPPSAGCLFGRTGCLAAQAVDGILMDTTNDSLTPLSLLSRFLPTKIPLLPLPLCGWNFHLASQGFKMHNSFYNWHEGMMTWTHLREFGANNKRLKERFLPWGFKHTLTDPGL